jgi:rRNA maturation RNase YbeY
MKFEVANRTKIKIKKDLVGKIIKKTLALSNIKVSTFAVSIVFVEEKEIKTLNAIYRRKGKATDILSFNYDLGYNKKKGNNIEGELIICPQIVLSDAKENKVKFDQQLAFVISHGVLHLLGVNHSKEMFKIQDQAIL